MAMNSFELICRPLYRATSKTAKEFYKLPKNYQRTTKELPKELPKGSEVFSVKKKEQMKRSDIPLFLWLSVVLGVCATSIGMGYF